MGTAPTSTPIVDEALEQLADLRAKMHGTDVDPTMWPQIIDSLPDGLIVVSESGRIHLVNVQMELMFGYHRTKLVGEPVHMLLAPDLATKHASHLERFFAAPSARPMNLAKHLAGRHATGRMILVQISIGPLISEAGVFGLAIVRRVGQHGALSG